MSHVPGGSEGGWLTAGHPRDFIVLTSLCSATTYVKGLNKSLRFLTYDFPSGFNIGL